MIPYIDMHCDTLMGSVDPKFSVIRNEGHVDLERLHSTGAMAQCFAVFLPQRDWFAAHGHEKTSDEAYIRLATGLLRSELDKASDLAAPARTTAELEENFRSGRVSALLTMEDGRAVDGKLENLDRFYEMGFRLGSSNLVKWAAQLGLTSRTGIELNGESLSYVGDQQKLYDPGSSISNQYTSKPLYAYYKIKEAFERIGD